MKNIKNRLIEFRKNILNDEIELYYIMQEIRYMRQESKENDIDLNKLEEISNYLKNIPEIIENIYKEID